MSKTKTLKCVVTGNETVYAGEFLNKKIQEYGSEEKLEKYYISKEVKAFLKKRYKIKDIRKVLAVSDKIPVPADDIIQFLETQFKDTPLSQSADTSFNISEFTNNKSDEDVDLFMRKYIIQS